MYTCCIVYVMFSYFEIHLAAYDYKMILVLCCGCFRFMIKKLYALALEKCAVESADNPMNQELLLGGHFYLMVLKVSATCVLYTDSEGNKARRSIFHRTVSQRNSLEQ